MISEAIRQDRTTIITKPGDLSGHESVEEFLARGGQIQQIEPGVCAFDCVTNKKKSVWSGIHSQREITRRSRAGKQRFGKASG